MKNTASGNTASKARGFIATLVITTMVFVMFGTTTQAAQQKQDAADTGGLGYDARTSVTANSTNNAIAAEFNAKTEAVGIGVFTANEHAGAITNWNVGFGNQVVGGNKGVTFFANGAVIGNRANVTKADNGSATLTKTGKAFNDTSGVVTVGNSGTTTNTHTAAGAAQYGTIEGGLQHANEVFGGTGLGVEIHCS